MKNLATFEISNNAVWQNYVSKNADGYGRAIIEYAARWAALMETHIAAGEALETFAGATSHEADTEGITGFMYGAAVTTLSECRNALPGMRVIPILPEYHVSRKSPLLLLRQACNSILCMCLRQASLYKSARFCAKSIWFLRDPPLAGLLRKRLTKGGSRGASEDDHTRGFGRRALPQGDHPLLAGRAQPVQAHAVFFGIDQLF